MKLEEIIVDDNDSKTIQQKAKKTEICLSYRLLKISDKSGG